MNELQMQHIRNVWRVAMFRARGRLAHQLFEKGDCAYEHCAGKGLFNNRTVVFQIHSSGNHYSTYHRKCWRTKEFEEVFSISLPHGKTKK